MQILIPNVCHPNTYVHDLAFALEEIGHQVIWGCDNFFYSRSQSDVIASQWPETYLALNSRSKPSVNLKKLQPQHLQALQAQLELQCQKTVILAFVHNVKPRITGNRELDAQLEKLFQICYGAAHGFVHLSQDSISELEAHYPASVYQDKPSIVISHGLNELLKKDYLQSSKPTNDAQTFRIFVPGAIRYWSEVSFLTRAFLEAKIPNKKLEIVGSGSVLEGKYPTTVLRRTAIRSIPNVSLFGHRLDDRTLCDRVVAADIVVVPRLWATNSGIPYLAATFGKRCIGPNVGNIPSVLEELKGILFQPDDPSSLARAMEQSYQEREKSLTPNFACPSWQEIARQIENFIARLKADREIRN